jgi:hypothetical protein
MLSTSKFYAALPTRYVNLDVCALLRYYATLSVSSVPTFRDNLSVSSSRVKNIKTIAQKSANLIYIVAGA